MTSRYEPLPSSADDEDASGPTHPSDVGPSNASARAPDPDRPLRASVHREFHRPQPSPWKRILVILAILVLGYGAWRLGRPAKPQVIYAQRYSDEFKYRPAASPIITETLKDGRIRIRGASLGGQGVREEDVPKSPAQVEHEKKVRSEEARKLAKDKLRESRERARERAKARRKAKVKDEI